MAIPIVGDFEKDPTDTADFGINWRAIGVLDADDDIQSSSWGTPAPVDLTIEPTPPPTGHDSETTAAWFSGGTPGTSYIIANTIVTTGGRTFQRSIRIKVKEL